MKMDFPHGFHCFLCGVREENYSQVSRGIFDLRVPLNKVRFVSEMKIKASFILHFTQLAVPFNKVGCISA